MNREEILARFQELLDDFDSRGVTAKEIYALQRTLNAVAADPSVETLIRIDERQACILHTGLALIGGFKVWADSQGGVPFSS